MCFKPYSVQYIYIYAILQEDPSETDKQEHLEMDKNIDKSEKNVCERKCWKEWQINSYKAFLYSEIVL